MSPTSNWCRIVGMSALSLCLAAACAKSEELPPKPMTQPESIGAERESASDVPDLDTQVRTQTRRVRRISLDALQASIGVVAGNDAQGNPIRWRTGAFDGLNNGEYSKFGDELGRPDYMILTEETTATTTLYMKFMRDLSVNVCGQMVKADQERTTNSNQEPALNRNLWRFAPVETPASDEQISANLRYLVLRFLAIDAIADSPLIGNLRTVYVAGAQSTGLPATTETAQTQGWQAVCIALLESPLFHLE